jgi:hypothetical protein
MAAIDFYSHSYYKIYLEHLIYLFVYLFTYLYFVVLEVKPTAVHMLDKYFTKLKPHPLS